LFDDFSAPDGSEALPRHPALFIFTLLLNFFFESMQKVEF
jgi:hypothetical protein